jgi:hypothetical protein
MDGSYTSRFFLEPKFSPNDADDHLAQPPAKAGHAPNLPKSPIAES